MHAVPGGEQHLITALRLRNEKAFEGLYRLHIKKIYAYTLSILKSPDLASDVSQEVFIRLWENAAHIQEGVTLLPYLYTMTRNMCLNVIRRAARESRITAEIADAVQDRSEDALGYIQRRQTAGLITDAVSALPPQRKKIYELCRDEGYTYRQAGEKLGIKDSTINSQMVKAIRFIKQYLVKNGAILVFFLLNRFFFNLPYM